MELTFCQMGPESGLFRVECPQDPALCAKLNQPVTSLTCFGPHAPVKCLNRMFPLPQSHPVLPGGHHFGGTNAKDWRRVPFSMSELGRMNSFNCTII